MSEPDLVKVIVNAIDECDRKARNRGTRPGVYYYAEKIAAAIEHHQVVVNPVAKRDVSESNRYTEGTQNNPPNRTLAERSEGSNPYEEGL